MVISAIVISPEAIQAQKPYLQEQKNDSLQGQQLAQVQEMDRYMIDLAKEIVRENSNWVRAGISAGNVSGFQLLEVVVESYVGSNITLETDKRARCTAEVNFDEINNQVLFLNCQIKKNGYTSKIEYNSETKELSLNGRDGAILTDQLWMIVANICHGKYE